VGPLNGPGATRYELPPGGISLLGYLVRRAHKTAHLVEAAAWAPTDLRRALACFGRFCAAASASYGRAWYQPRFDRPGDVVEEADPVTGVPVRAELLAREPVIRARTTAAGDGWEAAIDETVTGTTVGWRGLGMPAPTVVEFRAGGYRAAARGVVTAELVPLPGFTRVRGHGTLSLDDRGGARGSVRLARSGEVVVEVEGLEPYSTREWPPPAGA
jgi:hypothetical protein